MFHTNLSFLLQTNNTHKKFWAHDGTRTHELLNTGQTLYPQSYKDS